MILSATKRGLRRMARSVRMPIWSGPNQRFFWSVATRTRFLSGTYEPVLTRFILSILKPGQTFWDIGGHFGYYALLGARVVGDSGRVYTFEPSADNQWFLQHHVAWNHLDNVTVFPCAVGGGVGERYFGGDGGTGSGQLDGGSEAVHVESIDALVSSGRCLPPDVVKLDVQGAETEVLAGGLATLRQYPAQLMIATHGVQIHADCLATLRSLDYRVWDFPQRKLIIAAHPATTLTAVTL